MKKQTVVTDSIIEIKHIGASQALPTAMETNERVAKPFKTLDELYKGLDSLAHWPRVIELRKSTDYVYRGTDLSTQIDRPVKLQRDEVPKTIICHDLMGGYLEDKFLDGSNQHNSYHFYHWNIIDTFIYFSHHFITIPPFGWINAAHKHGVKMLGTIITEYTEGKEIWKEILKSEKEIMKFANALIFIAQFYKFEGWLLNIENSIDEADIPKLISFVKHLTDNIHDKIEESEIIWYDSVTNSGKLHWQNELNQKNECFFDCCDGIFLNYNWTDSGLMNSAVRTRKRNRSRDIYVGLDVWGRGCPGGGGFNSAHALQRIRDQGLSAAIFAPAWTFEYFGPETFPRVENIFWAQLMEYLFIHVPIFEYEKFSTSFCRGSGSKYYEFGAQISYEDPDTHNQVESNNSFYNLAMQMYQIVAPCTHLKFILMKILPPIISEDKSEAKPQECVYETAHETMIVLGNRISFEDKTDSFGGINCARFSYNISYNGGGCLELLTGDPKSYHRLFYVYAEFSRDIRARIIYRINDEYAHGISSQTSLVLILGNTYGITSFLPRETIDYGLGWKMSIFHTNMRTTHEIGVASTHAGRIFMGKIILEENRNPLRL